MFNKSLLQIDTSGVILTATRRLAEVVADGYDLEQLKNKNLSWPPLNIKPWKNWISELWQSQWLGPETLLNATKEHCLWLEITNQPAAIVEEVQRAWQILQDWLIPLSSLKTEMASIEVSQFVEWAEKFLQKCAAHHWLSESMLAAKLLQLCNQHQLQMPVEIILVGFDELTPLQNELISAIKKTTRVVEYQINQQSVIPNLRAFPDLTAELKNMADWVNNYEKKNKNYHHIACVIPNLNLYRHKILQIFKQTFAKEKIPFHISGGESFIQFPLVAIGIEALKLGLDNINLETISNLLQSPYLCQNQSDVNIGAHLAEELRSANDTELPLTALFTPLSHWQNQYPQHTWLQRWRLFLEYLQNLPSQALPSQWAEIFNNQLTYLGWPGGRSPTQIEFQILERWTQFLEEFSDLDQLLSFIDHRKAYHLFCHLMRKVLFQPKQTREESIHIHLLGVLETAGLEFDAIWVMGLNEESWPMTPRLNTFLPYKLQIQHNLPHSTAKREWIYANAITQRLLKSASQITLSFSAKELGQIPMPSPLIKQFDLVKDNDFQQPSEPWPFWREEVATANEEYDEQYGPLVNPSENIVGGSSILTLQSICPFKAFATLRLKAKPLNSPTLGISPKDRGKLLHYCLEKCWQQIKSHENLCAIADDNLVDLCQNVANSVVNDHIRGQDEFKYALFWQVEKIRLQKLLIQWLTLEKRPPFTVLEQETKRFIKIGELNLTVQIDRIDRLQNGKSMIIDYKTGLNHLNSWFSERLEQPQLPLYFVYANTKNQSFSALAFAEFRPEGMKFLGLHDESLTSNDYFPIGIKPLDKLSYIDIPKSWNELSVYWQKHLEKLSDEFCQGYAAKDPSGKKSPCRICELHSLCRIR